jgi:hypothetical protein
MAHTNKTRLGTNRVYVYLIPNNFTYHTSQKPILCVTEGQVCNPLRKPLRKPSRRASKLKHIRAMVKTWYWFMVFHHIPSQNGNPCGIAKMDWWPFPNFWPMGSWECFMTLQVSQRCPRIIQVPRFWQDDTCLAAPKIGSATKCHKTRTRSQQQMDPHRGFLKWGYPQSSSIYRWIFHEINHPSSG